MNKPILALLARRLSVLATVLATISLGFGAGPAAADDPAQTPRGVASATGWYLALGDSLAAGYQPGAPFDLDGGYVGGVLDAVRTDETKTNLRNLACPAETSGQMINGGGRCTYEEGSQLAEALVFLRAHTATTRLITLTMGANDLIPCMRPTDPPTEIAACVYTTLGIADPTQPPPAGSFGANFDSILEQLHQAAPNAQIVVTNYYNPYLASWLQGSAGQDMAVFSTNLQGTVNGMIQDVAAQNSAVTADVAEAFATSNWTLTSFTLGGVEITAPTNVARICELTWMCLVGNDHPNDTGYDVIADAVAARLS